MQPHRCTTAIRKRLSGNSSRTPSRTTSTRRQSQNRYQVVSLSPRQNRTTQNPTGFVEHHAQTTESQRLVLGSSSSPKCSRLPVVTSINSRSASLGTIDVGLDQIPSLPFAIAGRLLNTVFQTCQIIGNRFAIRKVQPRLARIVASNTACFARFHPQKAASRRDEPHAPEPHCAA